MPIPSSGSEPTGICATIRSVMGSIRNARWLLVFVTHTEPNPTSSQPGPTGTLTRSTMGSLERSYWLDVNCGGTPQRAVPLKRPPLKASTCSHFIRNAAEALFGMLVPLEPGEYGAHLCGHLRWAEHRVRRTGDDH